MLSSVRAIAVLLSAIVLAGCPGGGNPDAIIHYTQVGACTQATTPNGQVTAQASQAIVIFSVSAVDNTAVNQTWSFDPKNFVVNPPSSPQSNLGSTGPVSIPANQNVPVNSPVGIMVATVKPDGSDAGQTNYFLIYQQPGNTPPGTIGEKANASQTSYPFVQNCNSLLQ